MTPILFASEHIRMTTESINAELELRPLMHNQWSEAMTLAARSFLGEPFLAELFGTDPVSRFERAHRFYQSSRWHDDEMHLGAFVSDVLVGLCLTSPSGNCHVCRHTDSSRPPQDPLFLVDWEFEVNVQAAHAGQGDHAWLSRAAVDPALQGVGIGRALITESLTRLRNDGAPAVLLECQPHREDLYLACGFRRVRTFADPAGPDAILMRIDL